MASAVLTFTILVFSEIVPKTLGATYWKRLAPVCAHLTSWLIFLTFPFVLLSENISTFLGGGKSRVTTRAEMIETAEIGVNEGTLRRKESLIIKNLLMLDNIFASDIMTPRSVIFALESSETVGKVFKEHNPLRYSRIPVYEKSLDQIVGIAHRYRILDAISRDEDDKRIGDLMADVLTVHESTTVSSLLDRFIKEGKHIFMVIDDYGVVSGLVTLEDAIETLLGVEIMDELDSVADLRQYAMDLWLKRRTSANSPKGSKKEKS